MIPTLKFANCHLLLTILQLLPLSLQLLLAKSEPNSTLPPKDANAQQGPIQTKSNAYPAHYPTTGMLRTSYAQHAVLALFMFPNLNDVKYVLQLFPWSSMENAKPVHLAATTINLTKCVFVVRLIVSLTRRQDNVSWFQLCSHLLSAQLEPHMSNHKVPASALHRFLMTTAQYVLHAICHISGMPLLKPAHNAQTNISTTSTPKNVSNARTILLLKEMAHAILALLAPILFLLKEFVYPVLLLLFLITLPWPVSLKYRVMPQLLLTIRLPAPTIILILILTLILTLALTLTLTLTPTQTPTQTQTITQALTQILLQQQTQPT